MTFAYLDTETTGLNFEVHQLVEIGWWVEGEDEPHSYVPPHSLENADPFAMAVNNYWQRPELLSNQVYGSRPYRMLSRGTQPTRFENAAKLTITQELEGTTLVGSNIAFDAYRVGRWLGYHPWHYQLLELGTYAAGAFGLKEPLSLSALTENLRGRGYTISEPDHTAVGDVRTTRDCHLALVDYIKLRDWTAELKEDK